MQTFLFIALNSLMTVISLMKHVVDGAERRGMSNTTTDLQRPDFYSGGAVLPIPRRAQFNLPIKGQANYDNIMAALTHMQSDPGYGQGPSDVYGRVWWDSK